MLDQEEKINFDETELYVNFVCEQAVPKAMKLEELGDATNNDEEMCELKRSIEKNKREKGKDYMPFATELCVVGDVVMRGTRVIVPKGSRQIVLTIDHEGHPSIVSMKQRLRTKVWWPKMEKDVEKYVKFCASCQLVGQAEKPEPLSSTELPEGPWKAVAIDFLGPLPTGESVLGCVDYYSRFYEVDVFMKRTTADGTIR